MLVGLHRQQRSWSITGNLLLALADEDLSFDIGWLVHDYLVKAGLTAEVEVAVRPERPKFSNVAISITSQHTCNISLFLPSPPLKSTFPPSCRFPMSTVPRRITMHTKPSEIAQLARDAIGDDVTSTLWWPLFALEPEPHNILAGYLLWLNAGCVFTDDHSKDDAFYKLFDQVLTVAEQTSLVVEGGMNDMKENSRGTKGGLSNAATQQGLILDDVRRRFFRRVDDQITLQRQGGGGKKSRHSEEESAEEASKYEARSKAKTFLMFAASEAHTYALGRHAEALDLARTLEGREVSQRRIVEFAVEEERGRHARRAVLYQTNLLKQIHTSSARLHEVRPEAFGLRKLTGPGYKMVDMVVSLLVREVRSNSALNVSDRKAELTALSANELRDLMVLRFYGAEFHYVAAVTYAPDNMAKPAQDLAVKQAVGRGWVQRKASPAEA